eukprot:768453-Hanusia_phi.AAC.6
MTRRRGAAGDEGEGRENPSVRGQERGTREEEEEEEEEEERRKLRTLFAMSLSSTSSSRWPSRTISSAMCRAGLLQASSIFSLPANLLKSSHRPRGNASRLQTVSHSLLAYSSSTAGSLSSYGFHSGSSSSPASSYTHGPS